MPNAPVIRYEDLLMGPVTVASSATVPVVGLALNLERYKFIIQNRTGSTIYFKTGLTAPTGITTMISLVDGQTWIEDGPGPVCTGIVWLLQNSGGPLDVTIGEGV